MRPPFQEWDTRTFGEAESRGPKVQPPDLGQLGRQALWGFTSMGTRSQVLTYSSFPAQASGQLTVSQVQAPLRGRQLTPMTPSHPFNNFTFFKGSEVPLTSGIFCVQPCWNSWGWELQSLPTCLKEKTEGEQTLVNISINYFPVLTQTSSCVFTGWFIFWVPQTHFPSRYWLVWLSLGGVWLFHPVQF